MAAEATETRRLIIIYDKKYSIDTHLLVCYTSKIIFGYKTEEETEEWRKIYSKHSHYLCCSSPHICRYIH